jgi:general secretion pathway protein G
MPKKRDGYIHSYPVSELETAAGQIGRLTCASSLSEDTVIWTSLPSGHSFPSLQAPGLRERGFTLIELLVVVVIIGLLAGLVAPKYFSQIGKSNTNIARAQIEQLGKALDTYRLDVGSYPTTEQGLQALLVKPDGVDRWSGPYLSKNGVPPDPWGRPYRYKTPGDHGDYDLTSLGADGQPGGTGENTDVNSWDVAPAKSQ